MSGTPSRRTLLARLLRVVRPVLTPLLGSALCRIGNLALGIALFALGAGAVAATGAALASGAPVPSPWAVIGLMTVMGLAKAALRYGEQFLGHLVAFRAIELLRAEILRALIRRAPRAIGARGPGSGDLLTRSTKDVDRIEVLFAHTVAPVAAAVVVPAMVLATIGAGASWALAGAAAPFLLVALVAVPLVGHRRQAREARRALGARAVLAQHVTDSVQGIGEIVGYGRGGDRLARMAELDADRLRVSRPVAVRTALRRGATVVLVLGGAVAVAAVGASAVRVGELDAAALAAAVAAVVRLAETVRGVEGLPGALDASFAAAERVHDLIEDSAPPPDGGRELPARPAHEVSWEDVVYTYPGAGGGAGTTALRGVSLRAAAGKWTCLVGVSGSGKTSLARLAVRLDEPRSGRVLIDGIDVAELTGDSLRREIALVPQRAHLFRATVADNVRLARPGAGDEEVAAACRAARVHDEVMAMPSGYDTLVGERGTTVSGGQRQRLALARALLARPSVLVLDEFTSHLDPALDEAVRAAVRQWAPECTVIEIAHRLDHVVRADHVVVLDAGRVVQAGEPARLMADEDGPLRLLLALR